MRKYATNFRLDSSDMGNGEMYVTLQFRLKKKLAGWVARVVAVLVGILLLILMNYPGAQALLHQVLEWMMRL